MLNFSRTVLGIELGTTRIKAVLLDENHAPVASGSHVWENRLENGIWTYSLEDIVGGVQSCYADLRADIRKRTGEDPTTFGSYRRICHDARISAAGQDRCAARTVSHMAQHRYR